MQRDVKGFDRFGLKIRESVTSCNDVHEGLVVGPQNQTCGGLPGLVLKTGGGLGAAEHPGSRACGIIVRFVSMRSKGDKAACSSDEKSLLLFCPAWVCNFGKYLRIV